MGAVEHQTIQPLSLKNDRFCSTLLLQRWPKRWDIMSSAWQPLLPLHLQTVFAEVPSTQGGLLGTKGLPCDRRMWDCSITATLTREGVELLGHITIQWQRTKIYCAFHLSAQYLFLFKATWLLRTHTHTHTAIYTLQLRRILMREKPGQSSLALRPCY